MNPFLTICFSLGFGVLGTSLVVATHRTLHAFAFLATKPPQPPGWASVVVLVFFYGRNAQELEGEERFTYQWHLWMWRLIGLSFLFLAALAMLLLMVE